MKYDIFISYRRMGSGAGVAGELQSKLENRGYNVFLDVDEIGSGQFPAQISHAIEECNDFILVLSPGSLDRCANMEDWVRREIELADRFGKNIVGVALPGFVMPEADTLPISIQSLSTRQVFLWTHEYRNASFLKIEDNLVSSNVKKKRMKKIRLATLSVVGVMLIAAILFWIGQSHSTVEESKKLAHSQEILQSFDSHVQNARILIRDLPDTLTFRQNYQQCIVDDSLCPKLMQGIAEYDSALMLKKQYGDIIADSFGIESELARLAETKKYYLNVIVADMKAMMEIGGWDFAYEDWTLANILAEPSDRNSLDSLGLIISSRNNSKL